MKELFIRIDEVGTWKGTEHESHFGEICEEQSEGGISCYCFKKGCVERLYEYWEQDAYNTDSEGRQITIFEGEWVGRGSSQEDLATCTKTIAELPASMLFDNIDFFEDVERGYQYYYEGEEEEEQITLEEDKFDIVEKAIFMNIGIER